MRKQFFLLLTSIVVFSCNTGPGTGSKNISVKEDTPEKDSSPEQSNNSGWINSFKDFRNALFQNDRSRVKEFFSFPVMNSNNEIWYLVYEGSDSIHIIPGEIKPFTATDFDKYYHKIFPQSFINSILKIKTGELYKEGSFETIELKDGNTTFRTYAAFDKDKNSLSLNLASYTPVKTRDGDGQEVEDPGEYSVVYYFDVLPGGQIKFREVRIAG